MAMPVKDACSEFIIAVSSSPASDTVDFTRRVGLSRPCSVTGVWFVGWRR